MPIDPRIILGIQAPQFKVADPLESAHKSLALQALMGQQELQGLQVDEAKRSADANRRLTELFGRNPNATPEEVMAIDPARGLKMRQDLLANRKTEGEINKTRIEGMGKLLDFQKQAAGAVLANPTAENALQMIDQGERLATSLNFPEQAAAAAQQRAQVQALANDPEGLRRLVAGWAISADKLLPQFQTRNTGGSTDTLAIDPVTGKVSVTNTVANTATPGEIMTDKRTREEGALNRGVTIRGQNMTDARARETLAAGKAPAGYRFKDDGSLEAIPGGPADGKADKLGEAAKKQIAGIDSLGSAIDEYVAAVKGWDAKKMLSPDQRAAMGTKYNNMMLQAKEAFNLGVLNGPDYQILQSVIADPTQFKNALISSDAMAGQAEELKRLMERTRAAVKNQGRGEMPLSPTPAASASPSMPAVPKAGEVRKGYRFKGGDPSSPQSWEKV